MNTNEDISKDSVVNTLEIENNEDELKQLNTNNANINYLIKDKNRKKFINFSSLNLDKIFIIILFIIIFFCIIAFFISINNNNSDDLILNNENDILLDNITFGDKKITIAFVYSTLYANGIARFITVASNYLINTGKYNIYIITEKSSGNEYKYDSRINRIIESNRTLLKNKTKDLNIDFFILQNTSSQKTIDFFKSIGKFVIGMFHGLYVSSMFHGKVNPYKTWINFDNLDAFVFIGYDDYFFYKQLGFKNEIFIPNFL